MTSVLTSLESEILDWLLAGDEPVLVELKRQLVSSSVASREYTGSGLYINFEIPESSKRLHDILSTKPTFCFGDIEGFLSIGDHQQKIGFLLWIKDGHLNCLEAYTYGDEKWPNDFDEIQIKYLYPNGQRDLNELRETWEI